MLGPDDGGVVNWKRNFMPTDQIRRVWSAVDPCGTPFRSFI